MPTSVLVVDDDPTIRDVLAQVLEDEGYRALTAENGKQALAYLQSNSDMPDIMLLDLLMPEMDGRAVLDYLRRNMLQHVPVLVFSAQKPEVSLLQALDTELRDFIAKPFDLDELLVRMQRLLQLAPPATSRTQLLRIRALGSLRVERGDHVLFDENWRNKPAKTIFKLLFTHRGRRYPKDVLMEELWPDADPDAATNRLRVAIHELRKVLAEDGPRDKAPRVINQQEGSYFFDTSVPYWSDVDTFEQLLAQGQAALEDGNWESALQIFLEAEALYGGDYLQDDPFFDWTTIQRERTRENYLTLLGDVARCYAHLRQPIEAASWCRKILQREPWREEVYRYLMHYLAEGSRAHEALRAYDECRRVLHSELSAEPSPETTELYDRIRAGLRSNSHNTGEDDTRRIKRS